jgi:hypothetical protein
MDKTDFTKTLRELYTATAKVKDVTAPRGTFLCIDGQGDPGGPAFHQAIGAVYGAAFTVKFGLKKAGVLDFAVSKLEALWYLEDPERTPTSEWRWRVMVRIPDEVKAAHLRAAVKELATKGQNASAVKRVTFSQGKCLQVLHVGPYDRVADTYLKLHQHATDHDLCFAGPSHEIYLSDPRRVAPERLRTIVRVPVKRETAGAACCGSHGAGKDRGRCGAHKER